MAATNIPEAIDSSLLRPGRFDRKIYVPLPDEHGRRKILHYLSKDNSNWNNENIDIDVLVDKTNGYSGAEIQALCQRAALFAIEGNETKIDFCHFLKALSSFELDGNL